MNLDHLVTWRKMKVVAVEAGKKSLERKICL